MMMMMLVMMMMMWMELGAGSSPLFLIIARASRGQELNIIQLLQGTGTHVR
jgi:hypothetical protein